MSSWNPNLCEHYQRAEGLAELWMRDPQAAHELPQMMSLRFEAWADRLGQRLRQTQLGIGASPKSPLAGRFPVLATSAWEVQPC